MTTRNETESNACSCWIPVIATMIILLAIFDSGFAILMGAFAEVLMQLSHKVYEHGTAMDIGAFFHTITGGSLSIGDFAEGTIVKEIVKDLPDLKMLLTLAWVRLGFSFIAIVFGCLLAFRHEAFLKAILIWAICSLIFGVFAIILSWDIYRVLEADGIPGDFFLMAGIDFGLHVFWPLFLIWRIRRGLAG
tara:strand:- start:188 stop:760 length:573 start_codon:yes stop_codon:yes gene_type:complete